MRGRVGRAPEWQRILVPPSGRWPGAHSGWGARGRRPLAAPQGAPFHSTVAVWPVTERLGKAHSQERLSVTKVHIAAETYVSWIFTAARFQRQNSQCGWKWRGKMAIKMIDSKAPGKNLMTMISKIKYSRLNYKSHFLKKEAQITENPIFRKYLKL